MSQGYIKHNNQHMRWSFFSASQRQQWRQMMLAKTNYSQTDFLNANHDRFFTSSNRKTVFSLQQYGYHGMQSQGYKSDTAGDTTTLTPLKTNPFSQRFS